MTLFFSDDGFGPKVNIKYHERMNEFLSSRIQRCQRRGKKNPNLNIRTILREGRPSATEVDVVEKEGCDIIVMGNYGIENIRG